MNHNPMPPRKKRLGRTAGLPRTGGLSGDTRKPVRDAVKAVTR